MAGSGIGMYVSSTHSTNPAEPCCAFAGTANLYQIPPHAYCSECHFCDAIPKLEVQQTTETLMTGCLSPPIDLST
jgi:hypothetical protein